MGDRYELDLNCAYCKALNKDVWYAPTSSSDTFKCEKCKKKNFITSDFKAKKIKDIKLSDVEIGFSNTTSASWTDEDIKRMCKEHLKEIKERRQKK